MKFIPAAQLRKGDVIEWRHRGRFTRRGKFLGFNSQDFSKMRVKPTEGKDTPLYIDMTSQYRGLVMRDGKFVQ